MSGWHVLRGCASRAGLFLALLGAALLALLAATAKCSVTSGWLVLQDLRQFLAASARSSNLLIMLDVCHDLISSRS